MFTGSMLMSGGNKRLYLDGTTDTYVYSADHADWDFGSGDFRIEAQVKFSSIVSGDNAVASQWKYSTSQMSWGFTYHNSGNLYFYWSTTGANTFSVNVAWSPSLNTLYSLAVERVGTNLYFYVDGAHQGSTQTLNATIYNSTSVLGVGVIGATDGANQRVINGYMDEIRIIKAGTTVLLMHCDGIGASFTDSSASAHTLTASGNATQVAA